MKKQLLLCGELSDEMQKSHFPAVMAAFNCQAESLKTFDAEKFCAHVFTFTFRFLNSDFYFIGTFLSALNSEHKHKDECQVETLKTFETETPRAKRKTAIFPVLGQVHS